jgi:hypothetical protein
VLRLVAAMAVVATTPAAAQVDPGDQNPAPIRALSVDGGYAVRFNNGGVSEGFYRFSYRGGMVRGSGTPFQSASALDLLAPAPLKAEGDVPGMMLTYEVSESALSGGLLDAIGAKELPLPGLEGLHLRGTAQLSIDDQLDHLQTAIGLESPPLRLPGAGGTGITNWIVVGAVVERRDATDNDELDVDLALGTFRSFVGKALGWRKSGSVWRTAQKLERDILSIAPTLAAARELAPTLRAIPANQRTSLQTALLDLIVEAEEEGAWTRTVHEFAGGQADAITDQPTAAVYAEWSGWVDAAETPTTGRFKSLFTASLDYWFLPAQDDLLLRFRYELGYERSAPTIRRNQLLISIGVRR